MRNMLLTGLAAASGFCGLAIAAQAETLGINLSESGFGSTALLGPADPLILSQSFGTFSVNTEVNTVVNNPLAIDLSSTNISTSKAGTLTVEATASDLTSPLGLVDFLLTLTGHQFTGSGGKVTFAAYIDDSDTPFGTATLLNSSGLLSSFSFAGSGSANLTSPFSITEVLTIQAAGSGGFSLDASTTAVPEAPTWAMITLGFSGLGFVAFRRAKKTPVAIIA